MADEIDSRMEEIRLKNEELEKKHKEILEDELEAKKQGAIVSLKETAVSESKHRYDDVELDFDVKDDQKQHSKNPNYKPKNVRKPTLDKKYLDEIPPDPVNFLREDVDGEKNAAAEPRAPQQQHQQQHNIRNNNNRRNQRPPRGNNQGGERPEGNNHESRPRQQQQHRPRPPQNRNAQDNNGSNNQQNSSTSPRKIHPQALRTERRQLPTEISNSEEQAAADKSPSHANRPRRPIQKQQPRAITKDGLTVQITDEVRSVKIKPTERVGSGRVGHNIQAENIEGKESPEKPQSGSGDGNRSRNKNPRNKRNFKPKAEKPEFQHPILDKIVITKTSVQERLLRVKSEDGATSEPKVDTDPNQPATPEIIESSK